MTNRRMFSLDVIDTDRFLELPATSQNLYFHLGMRADDDGFVSSPKKIAAMIGCNIDDLRILAVKDYIIPFKSGVVVITDWNVNNWVRPDRKQNTRFTEELSMLQLENGVYKLTELSDKCQPDDNQVTTECHTEVRLGKYSLDNNKKRKKGTDLDKIVDDYDDSIKMRDTLKDFLKMRKSLKKPMTERALKLLLTKLDALSNDYTEKIDILNQSILNGWASVYPLKADKRQEKTPGWEPFDYDDFSSVE
ncbi:phage replication initiation protein [Clostridium sp. WLY-B-L2]|uniref:Phage replication initiation protein n=1 Tax=Clostridium aromativorans TaxID=2836848 RepID=A0ABS8N5P3_9CLOT|nr:phage replication initiation protein [Clostridium aromativorans]MCC9294380.1 phage replication initiation protein [Clostridium aromativorans]